ncbi:TPA: hypothetical protein L9D42_004537 [Klebsiella pneumoniae]|nr:hypothetical protein [Klebsiella pneumoniae]
MNIETVNELISSLETAGEPSIREHKFLKLAKAFKQLAAENVALEKAQQRISELEAYSKTALEFREAARDENRHLKLSLEAVEGRVIELESRAVTFKLPFTPEPSAYSPWVAKAFYQFHRDTVKSCFAVFSDACAVAGIKVEAE